MLEVYLTGLHEWARPEYFYGFIKPSIFAKYKFLVDVEKYVVEVVSEHEVKITKK